MNTRAKLLISTVAFLLISCVNLERHFSLDYATGMLAIPASVEKINFLDRRKHVSTGTRFVLPVFSNPRKHVEYYPEFDSLYRKLVHDLVIRNFTSGASKSYSVTIEMIEGEKEFSATFWKETEKVVIKLRITLTNGIDEYGADASGEYFVSSMDAKYKRFEKLYQMTLQTVTYKGLQELKTRYFSN